jgi:hypothetical protein
MHSYPASKFSRIYWHGGGARGVTVGFWYRYCIFLAQELPYLSSEKRVRGQFTDDEYYVLMNSTYITRLAEKKNTFSRGHGTSEPS